MRSPSYRVALIGFLLAASCLSSCDTSVGNPPVITKFQVAEFSSADHTFYFQWDSQYADRAVLVDYGFANAQEAPVPTAGEKKMTWWFHDQIYSLKVFNDYGSDRRELTVKGWGDFAN